MILVGTVGVWRRPTRDGTILFYLTWRERTNGGPVRRVAERIAALRTGPHPTRRQVELATGEARQRAYERQQQLEGRVVDMGPPLVPITLLEAIADHCEDLKGFAESTRTARERNLLNLLDFLELNHPTVAGPVDLNVELLLEWARDRRDFVSMNTLATELAHLDGFLADAKLRHWRNVELDTKPVRKAMRIRARYKRPTIVSDETIRAAAGESPAAWVLAATGMRIGELCGLPSTAWNAATASIKIPEGENERTKCHGRELPVGQTTAAKIEQMLTARQTAGEITKILRGHGITAKSCRQWFNSTLERMDCPDRTIKRLMGHAQPATQRAYSFQLAQLRPWMERVEKLLIGETPDVTI